MPGIPGLRHCAVSRNSASVWRVVSPGGPPPLPGSPRPPPPWWPPGPPEARPPPRPARRWIAHELLHAHLPFVPGPNDRVLLMNAYAHGAALLAATWLESGASVELIDGVDVDYADDLFARGEITAVFAPPTVLAKLVQGTRHQRIDGIKCIFCGTATLQPALYRAAAALFGPVIRVTYGKSEMFNPITVLEIHEASDYYRDLGTLDGVCFGTPARSVEVEIPCADGHILATHGHGAVPMRDLRV